MTVQESSWRQKMSTLLAGKVVIVTGASRGVGKGVAVSLGAAGATVYVTGRSADDHPATVSLPGSVDDNAQAVTHLGGTWVAWASPSGAITATTTKRRRCSSAYKMSRVGWTSL
jgi:NAD(P)-dependent dehydrogenase (short-subunit alcohol dehydrogenase family)